MSLQGIVDYLSSLSARDICAPIATMVTGFFTAHFMHQQTKNGREGAMVAARVAQEANITERFKALMDGYEGRISDLTSEVQALRAEVKESRVEIARLRQELQNARAKQS